MPSSKLKFSLVMGVALALAALAVPTAASAADACVPGKTVSAATQPWLDFSQSPNAYEGFESALEGFLIDVGPLLATVTTTFTQEQYEALVLSLADAQAAAQAAQGVAGDLIESQKDTLTAALHAVNPAGDAAAAAIFDGFDDTISASQYGTQGNAAFDAFFISFSEYLESVETAITAMGTVPTVPPTLTDNRLAALAAFDGFGAYAGGVVYGGAAAQVDRTCPATLAATGMGNQAPGLAGGALVVLLGGALLVVARRRREVTAA